MQRIIFMLIPVMICLLAFRPMDAITVKGKIMDENGSPLPGVTISVKSQQTATTSGNDGSFQINVPDENATLVFTYVGYETQEVKLKGKKEITINLKASVQALQEVMIAANEKRQYKSEALMGRLPGISVTQNAKSRYNTSSPGGSYEMRNREPRPVDFNTEDYDGVNEVRFLSAKENPLSTFSIDVDAASYSNIRRFLNQGQLPPAGAVRIEEMINYFKYDYPQPAGEHPFSINTEVSAAPWNKEHKLVLIGLQGKKIPTDNLPASNLVFLIDVSGSMGTPNKLPLVKASMKMLVDQLREKDKVSIVVYAGAAGLVLKPTSGEEKTKIKDAIDNLEAGGSTAGGAGIKLAYKTANEAFVKGGNNRVILCSDGDFNVGESSDDAMERLIEKERASGVYLTILGYGMGNYKDNKMQKLADKGNGNHAYIDGISEAKKVLVNEFGGTLFTIAKDVKLQVEFNPAVVQGYRLIGYENRMLAKEDFNDDKKDAGELGSGHTVTALYEIIPVGLKSEFMASVDPLKYQKEPFKADNKAGGHDLFTVKFRYKAPDGDKSKLLEAVVKNETKGLDNASENFRFATAVAEMGLLLRDSKFKGASSYDHVIKLAKAARGEDEEGYRAEFIRLVASAKMLAKGKSKSEGEGQTGKR
ncbi:von Willebrand factor type A domain-containing protein [Terrimonas sp. NA20]|uniref:von Willebrand factor type A domain-containing protein n=1 Tax=Terrimonas ginsenosidimutans TaxID=2908004 RepID=A0ABS9KYK9_9BACT|nr:VWA domain-containing protein [Terrimonas ginsenosidimutans]MCG2617304.1 von Willebrand factor type A domain-containing protein [Terrimonas ginsenosidimutans]